MLLTFACPRCGYVDSPIWKPLFWKLYGSYASFDDFKREHPELAAGMEKGERVVEDETFIYERHGKTRDVVHRFPRAFLIMRDRRLYEKTPSERREE
jgi:hypothetical protein